MTNKAIPQSQKRFQESLGPLFSKKESQDRCLFLKSSSDVGVIRNKGRNGARFAPEALLASFKKFSQDEKLKNLSFQEIEVSSSEEEIRDFHAAQTQESLRIKEALKTHNGHVVHIGGGHDHIYPLLMSYSDFKKIVVVNIDAHADTRDDEDFHSGTPFRQFARDYKGGFSLFQIGLHPFSNTFSTLSPLPKGKMEVLWKNEFSQENLREFFQKIHAEVDPETLLVFSLDADALSGHEVPGVSAVNPDGFTLSELKFIWQEFRKLSERPFVLGVYELNPLYDSLASISMRTIGSFLFHCFR